MSFIRILTLAAMVWGCAAHASAQSVSVQFQGGTVSISAQNAPVGQILAEWARLGGTTFVNADSVPGAPVTLQLQNVPERQAIDVLLRSASGYMVAAREVPGSGASGFDRVLILPTSAPRATSSAPAFVAPPQPQPVPQFEIDPDDPEENPPNDAPPEEPAEDRPVNPRRVPFLNPNVNGRPLPPQPFQPDPDDDVEPAEEPEVAPGNPFGVLPGSSRPGTITPVPQQRDREPQPDPEP